MGFHITLQLATLPLAPFEVASEFGKKTAIGQAEQDPNLPHSASYVFDRVLAMLLTLV